MDPTLVATLGLLASLVTILSALRVLSHLGMLSTIRHRRERNRLLRGISKLGTNVQIDHFSKHLQKEATLIDRGSQKFDQYTFISTFAYVSATTDKSGTVLCYAVTSRSSKFNPKLSVDFGHPTLDAVLCKDTFRSVAEGCHQITAEVGARRFQYAETHYLGNPGLYQTYVLAVNDAGYVGRMGGLQEIAQHFRQLQDGDLWATADSSDFDVKAFREETIVNSFSVVSPMAKLTDLGSFALGADRDVVRVIPD